MDVIFLAGTERLYAAVTEPAHFRGGFGPVWSVEAQDSSDRPASITLSCEPGRGVGRPMPARTAPKDWQNATPPLWSGGPEAREADE